MKKVRIGLVGSLGEGLGYGNEYGNAFALLRRAGFDCTDVGWVAPSRGARNPWKHAAQVGQRIASHGLDIVGYHSVLLKPWAAVGRNLAMQSRQMECARSQGAVFFVVHLVWEEFQCFPLGSARARRKQFRFDVETLSALGQRAADLGLRLLAENNPGFPLNYYWEVLENLPPEAGGAILDVGHANLQPKQCRVPIEEVICRLGPRIEHLHLNDNDGVSDQHLPVLAPYGTVDWKRIFRTLKRSGYQGVLNEELPPWTGLAWNAWALLKRQAQPLRDLWAKA